MGWALDKNERLTCCVATLLVALVFSLASPASGQGTQSDDPPPVPLEEGEPAPYAGDLWSVGRSLRMIFRAEACQERAAVGLKHEARKFQIELKFGRDRAAAIRQADQERIAILMAALDDAVKWYESPVFVATVASVATLALVLVVSVVLRAALSPFAQTAAP